MDLLTQIANKYGSDKGTVFTVSPYHPPHNFTSIYNRLFESIRFDVKSVLEIGVFQGSSLRMWEEFFPYAKIYGVDYDPRNVYNSERAKTFVFEQTDKIALQKMFETIGSDLDIIIDDGSHDIFDQQKTFLSIFKNLKSKGFYVVEDLHSSTNSYAHWFLNKYNINETCNFTTLNILQNWQINKTLSMPYFDRDVVSQVEQEIDGIDIFDIYNNKNSITGIIRKK